MSEIEKYYNGEIHVDFDNEKEELNNSITWWSNRFNAVERDNRELKKTINGMIENEEKYLLEINKLQSIIKEVREYIEKRKDTQNWRKESLKVKSTNIDIVLEQYRDILEMLEKENK